MAQKSDVYNALEAASRGVEEVFQMCEDAMNKLDEITAQIAEMELEGNEKIPPLKVGISEMLVRLRADHSDIGDLMSAANDL